MKIEVGWSGVVGQAIRRKDQMRKMVEQAIGRQEGQMRHVARRVGSETVRHIVEDNLGSFREPS